MLVLCRLVIAKNFIWMTTSKILRLTSKKKSRIGFDLVDRVERHGPFACIIGNSSYSSLLKVQLSQFPLFLISVRYTDFITKMQRRIKDMCDENRWYDLRPRKEMNYDENVMLEDLNNFLISKGVTLEELAEDDRKEEIGGKGFRPVAEAEIAIPTIGRICMVADKTLAIGNKYYVADCLDRMTNDQFYYLWYNDDPEVVKFKNSIMQMFRYPGGLHEWLMIAAIPIFKEMGIPMDHVKTVRTPINETVFWVDGEECKHGRKNSGRFHVHLLNAIRLAYLDYAKWCQDNPRAIPKKRSEAALSLLKKRLKDFAKLYYPPSKVIPEVFKKYIFT